MSSSERYYARGKLLITGEYAVLDGAVALAIPCNFGQYLEVEASQNSNEIDWNSLDVNGISWFKVRFDKNLSIIQTTDQKIAEKLQHIFQGVIDQNPDFRNKLQGNNVTTKLEFDRNWGLGSSSTLIHLISQWAMVNPYSLLEKTFGGSGYDIACADANGPILYQVGNPPEVNKVRFNPTWTDKMHFVYLGKKQVSSKEITKYSELNLDRKKLVTQISELSQNLLDSTGLEQFSAVLEKHESLMSKALGYPTIKSQRFPNIKGVFKSLGAWGGDFVLFIGEEKELEKINNLGYQTILGWNEMLMGFDE